MKKKSYQHKKFTEKDLLSCLPFFISTIILMIGLVFFDCYTRNGLSGTAREAQYAFYAADAGVECALYAQSLPGSGPLINGGGTFTCGATPSVDVMGNGNASSPWEFYVLVDTASKTCAHVSVFDNGKYSKNHCTGIQSLWIGCETSHEKSTIG
jgi:hypothetical protein